MWLMCIGVLLKRAMMNFALNVLSRAPYVINVVFVCPLLNCKRFLLKSLRQKQTLLTSLPTLFDFRPSFVKNLFVLKHKT